MKKWLEAELETVRQMDALLWPVERPSTSGLDHSGMWCSAPGAGGDYLDYLRMPGGRFGLAVGDVACRGLPAMMLRGSLHGIVRSLGQNWRSSLDRLVSAINRLFARIAANLSHASLFVSRYDDSRRRLRFVNAGHEPPLLLRRMGDGHQAIWLPATGPVVGAFRAPRYREQAIDLVPGDTLVAYTDGLWEAVNAKGEAWGMQRLVDTVDRCAHRNAGEIASTVLAEVSAFRGAAPQADDMTVWVGQVGVQGSRVRTPHGGFRPARAHAA